MTTEGGNEYMEDEISATNRTGARATAARKGNRPTVKGKKKAAPRGVRSVSSHVIVTGGAGYVGSHVCKALAAEGFVPVAVDNLERGHQWAVKWGPFEHGDIQDQARLEAVMKKYEPVAVMHFAAYAYAGESMDDPAPYYKNNVSGTLYLLAAMRRCSVDHIVFSSSCAVYGVPATTPIPEDHPQHPINPYGASKAAVERILCDFDAAYGIRSVFLRYFNAAGADPEGDLGEAHNPETHLIPLVLDVALGRRPNVAIYGADYDTSDGTCIRDFIHVCDLADAHLLALRRLLNTGVSECFNLGNGEGSSVKQVIDVAASVTKIGVPFAIMPRRLGDPPVLVADATRARKILRWRPRRPELRTQIADAWQWHRRYYGATNLGISKQAGE